MNGREGTATNATDIGASIERIMARVDYYLHCELDDDHDHDRPDTTRYRLEDVLREELLRAGAIGLVSATGRTSGGEGPSQPNCRNMNSALTLPQAMPKPPGRAAHRPPGPGTAPSAAA